MVSVALLFEYEAVLKRNNEQLNLKHSDIDSILDAICALCSFQKIHYLWRPLLPDPKDDHVLELAVASEVKTITTFNKNDFKRAEAFGLKILTLHKLLDAIKWKH